MLAHPLSPSLPPSLKLDHNQLGGKAVKRVKGAGGVGVTAATCISMPGLLQTSGLSPLRFFERLEDFSRQVSFLLGSKIIKR